jgi:hypothetical protein
VKRPPISGVRQAKSGLSSINFIIIFFIPAAIECQCRSSEVPDACRVTSTLPNTGSKVTNAQCWKLEPFHRDEGLRLYNQSNPELALLVRH